MARRLPENASALLLLLALALGSGCLESKPGPTLPPWTSPQPNFLGNWSLAEGSFAVVRIETEILRANATTGQPVPYPAACTTPYTYEIDADNATVRISGSRALHPLDPGPMRVLFLSELRTGAQCVYRGPYGINENATSPPACVATLPEAQRAQLVPWRCHVPFDLGDSNKAVLWLNSSFTLDPAEDGGYRFTFNGRTFPGNASGEVQTIVLGESLRYEARTTVSVLGQWPYASVRRS